jgi:hypothetical protein
MLLLLLYLQQKGFDDMNKFRKAIGFAIFVLLLSATQRLHATDVSSITATSQIPVETVVDKIRGGLLGQILGNLNGVPHEMKYINEPGNVLSYVPALPDGARTDDDTDFEWIYILEMQKNRNVFLSTDDITTFWMERINRGIWCSNRYARYLMDIGLKPPFTGYVSINPWSNFNVAGQFLSETFGLVAPAMPQTAARIGLNYTTVSIDGEPAQGTQLFTSMISMAFVESDVKKIVDAGVASLDPASKLVQVINDVITWHGRYPNDWREMRRLLKEKYTYEGGGMRDRNGIELNTGAIIASLLYGEGDFAESVKMAFNMGWDADCSAATVGTIMGTVYGYRKMMTQSRLNEPLWQIVDRYRNTTRENMPMDETITSFADRIIELFEMVNEQNGGKKVVVNNTVVYEIPVENPAPVKKLVSFENQIPQLKAEHEQTIINDILNGNREAKARAAYLAVCLEMDKDLNKKYPRQWKDACFQLNGYWKIMANIFQGDGANPFKSLARMRDKFIAAGFKPLAVRIAESDIYQDKEIWKNPAGLY